MQNPRNRTGPKTGAGTTPEHINMRLRWRFLAAGRIGDGAAGKPGRKTKTPTICRKSPAENQDTHEFRADVDFVAIDASGLFPRMTTGIGFDDDLPLQPSQRDFIQLFGQNQDTNDFSPDRRASGPRAGTPLICTKSTTSRRGIFPSARRPVRIWLILGCPGFTTTTRFYVQPLPPTEIYYLIPLSLALHGHLTVVARIQTDSYFLMGYIGQSS